jgi:hypothetical protein
VARTPRNVQPGAVHALGGVSVQRCLRRGSRRSRTACREPRLVATIPRLGRELAQEPGALDGGTHTIFALPRTRPARSQGLPLCAGRGPHRRAEEPSMGGMLRGLGGEAPVRRPRSVGLKIGVRSCVVDSSARTARPNDGDLGVSEGTRTPDLQGHNLRARAHDRPSRPAFGGADHRFAPMTAEAGRSPASPTDGGLGGR